jgi:hypothetical protein
MLHDGYETVGTNSRVDLYPDSVLGSSPKLLDLEVLFEPLEEQLYLPSILVEVGNLLGSQFHGVGQEHELTALLLIIEPNEPQMFRIAFLTAVDGQFYLCISEYSLGHPPLPTDALVLQVCLGSHNEKGLHTMYPIKFLEVVIATVEDVVSTYLYGDFLHRLGIMD